MAIAVFINTPSQPSSMAIAASEAVPTPASTSTGTLALSMMICRFHGLSMPMPEPISEAKRHHRDAADFLQLLGEDRIIARCKP